MDTFRVANISIMAFNHQHYREAALALAAAASEPREGEPQEAAGESGLFPFDGKGRFMRIPLGYERRDSEEGAPAAPQEGERSETESCLYLRFYLDKKKRACFTLLMSVLTLGLLILFGILSLTQQTLSDPEFKSTMKDLFQEGMITSMRDYWSRGKPKVTPGYPKPGEPCSSRWNDWSAFSSSVRHAAELKTRRGGQPPPPTYQPLFLSPEETEWVRLHEPELRLNDCRVGKLRPLHGFTCHQGDNSTLLYTVHRMEWYPRASSFCRPPATTSTTTPPPEAPPPPPQGNAEHDDRKGREEGASSS